MSKVKRKSCNHAPTQQVKEIHNPFQELSQPSFYDHHTRKSPKMSKKAGKCFQLVLICQKLLKPFSSSTKVVPPDHSKQENNLKQKSKSTQEINRLNRPPLQTTTPQTRKVDACVQTQKETLPDISQIMLDDNSEDFPYDVDESLKEPYWDLDIDSAIVGDFNSMSAFSLDEQIDPHYATIKMTADGRVIEKPQCAAVDQTFYTSIYHNEKTSCSNSNASSPKSGIYSKIIKPRKIENDLNCHVSDYYRLQNGARMNSEKMMAIRSQLGLSRDLDHYYPSSECSVTNNNGRLYQTDTPDIPRRDYGSSVINYISQLRQHDSYQHSYISPSLVYLDKELSSSNIYSPIWFPERGLYGKVTAEHPETPASEPTAPKRSINKVLHQLNPTYLDDSSEDTSTISLNSPIKIKYSYPRNFSDNYPKRSFIDFADRNGYVNLLTDEINRFRHMDSDMDITDRDRKQCIPPLHYQQRLTNGIVTDATVPLDVRETDLYLLCDDKMFLQPLMERSCEEEYFKRDILSSLDYLSV